MYYKSTYRVNINTFRDKPSAAHNTNLRLVCIPILTQF